MLVKTAVITFNPRGALLARLLRAGLPGCRLFFHNNLPAAPDSERFEHVVGLTRRLCRTARGIVYIAPCGIAVRALAGCIRSKLSDPAVVVVDVGGRFAVSLLSGHEGGGNELAVAVANILGAEPVISTTTEAVKTVTVGVGCRRGTSAKRIKKAVEEVLKKSGISLGEVRCLASAEIKRNENGLKIAARQLGVPLRIMPDWLMRRAGEGVTPSAFVWKKTKLPGVAEPAALSAGRNTTLILKRQIVVGVTVAVARESCLWSA